jgi:hypothetical protein
MFNDVARAMEVARLSPTELSELHRIENAMGRCLIPGEIQERFRLSSLKVAWRIPNLPSQQRRHSSRILTALHAHGCFDNNGGSVNLANVSATHIFDAKVAALVREGQINFAYQGRSSKKRSEVTRC